MSGQEAKDYGVVDEVISNRELAAVPSAEGTS
jgi:ATP-dependent protease ClpP protease subunit